MRQGIVKRVDVSTPNGSLMAVDEASTVSSWVSHPYGSVYRWMALSDSFCILLALFLASLLRFGTLLPSRNFWQILIVAPLLTVAFGFSLGLYRVHQCSSLEEFRRIIVAVSMTITALVMLFFWSKVSYPRLWVGYLWVVSLTLVASTRRMWHRRIRQRWAAGQLTFATLIVGSNWEAAHLASLLAANRLGFRPLGFVRTGPGMDDKHAQQLPIVGPIEEVRNLIRKTGANCLFVAATALRAEDMTHVLKAGRLDGVEIRVTANVPTTLSCNRVTPQSIGGLIALSVNRVRLTRAQAVAKRSFDVAVSAIALVALSPLLIAIAIAIKLTDPGPVLFHQKRVGHHQRPFVLLKFRTMIQDAEFLLADLLSRNEADGPLFKLRQDPRITKLGRWLRRYSLDELPQLWNVLKGEMSLVGPRPPLPSEVDAYEDWQLDRLEVPPGITGLWQVNGRSELSFDEYVRLDLFYIENWSIAYDLFVVAKTIPILLKGRGAY